MTAGKLIQVTTSSGRGGRESLPLALHRAWQRQGKDCLLLGGEGTPLAVNAPAHVVPVARGYVGLARAVRLRLKSAMSSGDVSLPVVISHFTHDLPALRIALLGMPDVPLVVIKHVSPGRPKKDVVHRWSYARVSRLLCVSEYIAVKCRRVYPIESTRIGVWYPGVDAARFAFNAAVRQRVRSELKVTDGQHVFGYVGRVTPNKGLEDLLGAFRALAADHPAARLWIVGGASADERDYESGLHQFVTARGLGDTVRFCGYQDRVEDFLSAMDTFVTPSREEAFGLTTVEAMAAGRPVAGFHTGGTPEIVVDGTTGLLADAEGDSAANLLGVLRTLMADPSWARELGVAGRERATDLFSTLAMATRLEDEIRSCQS